MRQVQILRITKKLCKLWLMHPTLKMGQVITCIFGGLKKEVYDFTDKEFEHELNRELNKSKRKI